MIDAMVFYLQKVLLPNGMFWFSIMCPDDLATVDYFGLVCINILSVLSLFYLSGLKQEAMDVGLLVSLASYFFQCVITHSLSSLLKDTQHKEALWGSTWVLSG